MGMYDDITCEHVLPFEPKPRGNSFQTKDFDRLMEHYTITKDGRLLKREVEVPFHGMLSFYTYTDDNMWFEYEAKFTDGRLIEIRPISIYRNGARGLQEVIYPPPSPGSHD
jgi:hypothetical protein